MLYEICSEAETALIYESVSAAGDKLLPYTMPQAEYMYGCSATSVGMLLGYYDLYGYTVNNKTYDFSNLIEGTISVNSRGSDGGSIYDMKDPSLLCQFIASEGYISRFYQKTPAEELPYTFVGSSPAKGLNISVWDCIADYLGTGQYWRGNEDLSTTTYMGTLKSIAGTSQTYTVDGLSAPISFADLKYGLSLLVEGKGYSLDTESTVTKAKGEFTFQDYKSEIDAGRPVLISMRTTDGQGHMVIGYGYNEANSTLIFDDTYENDCRMTWSGTYKYAGGDYSLSNFTTVVFNVDSGTETYTPGTWTTDWKVAETYASAHDVPILAVWLDNGTSSECRQLQSQVFESSYFNDLVSQGQAVLFRLTDPSILGKDPPPAPTCAVMNAQGTVLSTRTGYQGGTASAWLGWFSNELNLYAYGDEPVQLFSSGLLLSGAKVVSDTTLGTGKAWDSMCVLSGGTAMTASVEAGGVLRVSSGGSLTGAEVLKSGSVQTEDGAVLSGTFSVGGLLNAAGHASVSNLNLTLDLTGHGTDNDWLITGLANLDNPSFTVLVKADQAEGAYRLADGATGFSGTMTVDVKDGAVLAPVAVNGSASYAGYVYSLTASQGGLFLNIADDPGSGGEHTAPAELYSGGVLVSSGSAFSGITVGSGGYMALHSGGGAAGCVIASGGRVTAESGATLSNMNVSYGGVQTVNRGTILSGKQTIGGTLNVSGTVNVTSTQLVLSLSDRAESDSSVISDLSGLAGLASFTVNVSPFQSGTYRLAANAASFAGKVNLTVDGTAAGELTPGQDVKYGSTTYTLLKQDGVLALQITGDSGGTGGKDSVLLFSSGVQIAAGGLMQSRTLFAGGPDLLQVRDFGLVFDTVVKNGGSMTLGENGVASRTVISSGGRVSAGSGGSACNTTVWGGGRLIVSSGGLSISGTVSAGGSMMVASKGTAYGTEVRSGGVEICRTGSILKGEHVLEGRLVVSGSTDASGASLILAADSVSPDNTAFITNYARLSGASLTVSVKEKQAQGKYMLAAEAADFTGSVSVISAGGAELGSISLDSGMIRDGRSYTLSITPESTLAFSIENYRPRSAIDNIARSQIVAWDGIGKTGYLTDKDSGGFVWKGIWEWSGNESWSVLATGRFASTAEGDGILLYNKTNSTFAAWTDISRADYGYVSLAYVGNDFQVKAVATLDSDRVDDIVIVNDAGSVGILSNGTDYHDVLHYEANDTPEWEFLGAGHFDVSKRAGMDSLLFRRVQDNALFAWDSNDPTYASWDWNLSYLGTHEDGWDTAAIGDFSGDGTDDILMRNLSDGTLFVWENGDPSHQRYAGTLDPEEWEIAAVGDYDGDGCEDILLREQKSGWGGLGFWGGAYAGNWQDLNAAIETRDGHAFTIVQG